MGVIGKGRLDYVDATKGLAIIGVYFGHHLILPNSLTAWFWSFHMPLFFIITGMYSHSLTEQKVQKVFSSGIRNLVLPYFVTELVLTICLLVMLHQSAVLLKPIIFTNYLCQHLFVDNHPIWFLLALFYGKCLISITFTPPPICKQPSQALWGLGLFFVGWKYGKNLYENGLADYASLMKGFLSVVYIYMGILLRHLNFEKVSINKYCIALTVVAFAGQVSFNMYYFDYPIGLFNVFTSSLVCISLLIIVKGINARKYIIVKNILAFFAFLGKNTLFILCAHTLELILKISRFIPTDNTLIQHGVVFFIIMISIHLFKRIPLIANIYKIQ